MKIRGTDRQKNEVKLEMTPMIDVVFQLLVFFIFTFKITAEEGDFSIIMPAAAAMPTMTTDVLEDLLVVRLTSGEDRYVDSIHVSFGTEERTFAGVSSPNADERQPAFNSLHNFVLGVVGQGSADPAAAPAIEAELEIDYDLRYEDAIAAIEAISGYRRDDGQIITLIEKIRFRNPGEATGEAGDAGGAGGE
jgi:biopolymer transport protein ExbD